MPVWASSDSSKHTPEHLAAADEIGRPTHFVTVRATAGILTTPQAP
jgi:hypothetical protein